MYLAQDDSREKQIIRHCGLVEEESRILHDATDPIYDFPFEIKSVTKNKGVSTARQVHVRKVEKWRSRYWICAKGPRTKSGMDIKELYLLHPEDLEPFFSKCEKKIRSKFDVGIDVLVAAYQSGMDKEVLRQVKKTLEVGTRLDDPTIPWRLVQTGLPLSIENSLAASESILEFIGKRPLGAKHESLAQSA